MDTFFVKLSCFSLQQASQDSKSVYLILFCDSNVAFMIVRELEKKGLQRPAEWAASSFLEPV